MFPKSLFLPILFLLMVSTSCTTSRSTSSTIELSALEDFTLPERADYAPAYRHEDKGALAIDAAKYKNRFAIAETVFSGPAGTYRLALTTLGETDGESSYELFIDGERKGQVTNEPTETDYAPQAHDLGKVRLEPGQVISITFNSASNGLIPEGDGFAFSRGRWTGILIFGR
jgi:hypothetical protein